MLVSKVTKYSLRRVASDLSGGTVVFDALVRWSLRFGTGSDLPTSAQAPRRMRKVWSRDGVDISIEV